LEFFEPFLEPFYLAADNVFKNMFQKDIQSGLIQYHDNFITTREANINIGIIGDLAGSVIYSFSAELAFNISSLIMGMNFNELNGFVTSAVAELSNIISGNTMTYLSEQDCHCEIKTPEVFLGIDSMIQTKNSVFTIPIRSAIGNFEINVAIESR
jgi:chemotaxis protein CheX